ncbi:MAG: MarR family transcriptional regulator [Tardiphaga sp.]|nr:MarR family transcriptional regulator [Tardiphaga sp.]
MAGHASDLQIAEIRDASRRLVRELGFMRNTLAGTDLPPSAVHALIVIGARGSLTAAELSEVLLLEKSSISRMLRKLIETGELAEKASDHDARAKLMSLTRKGRATLAGINRFAQNQVASALAHLDPAARRIVQQGLASYAGALEASRTARTGLQRRHRRKPSAAQTV